PTTTSFPSLRIPLSSAIPPRSTSSEGRARRCFRVGISVMPPARIFASSFAARAAASARLFGFWYSKAYIRSSPLFRRHAGPMRLDRLPDPARGCGHVDVPHAQGRERVDDGVHDRAGRADGARLAAAFDAERV